MGTQDALFPDDPPPPRPAPVPADAPAPTAPRAASRTRQIGTAAWPWPPDADELAGRLPPRVHLGTSSWSFPGWEGLVWDGAHAETMLARRGLAAYARHPLLRTVSLDRAFYQPLSVAQYAAYAEQVPADFRFMVKAPSVVADARVRGADGRGMRNNEGFLDAGLAWSAFVEPALQGLGAKAGVLVFQLSPLGAVHLRRMPEQIERLAAMLRALPPLAELRALAPDLVLAVEVRNPEWLVPAFTDALRAAGATYCLGLHPRLPPIEAHGAQGYEEAKGLYAPFDRLVDADPETRATLVRVARATTAAGHGVYIAVNNKAEGSAPRTVEALARLLVA